MKTKIILSLLCIFSIAVVQAQNEPSEYRPFAEDGKTWKIQVGLIKENIYGSCVDGDTLINGENWKKVYNYVGRPSFGYTYYAAIRDVGKKVYAIAKGSTKPRLLYDFGLKEGDIVRCGIEGNSFVCLNETDEKTDTLYGFPLVSYLRVERIETITANGLQHRRFRLSFLDSFHEPLPNEYMEEELENVIWVEGVGSGAGPFSPWLLLPPKYHLIQSCMVNDECIFYGGYFYENSETSAIGNPRYNTNDSGVKHDLQGRRLDGQPAKGIYIKDGKKHVKK